jgi:hypothetical protein
MPAELRSARRDEVDDDLWCQHEEANAVGRSPQSLGVELFLRLLLGIPADVSWRLAHARTAAAPVPERSSSLSTRVLGTIIVLAAASWVMLVLIMVVFGLSSWEGPMGPFMLGATVGGGLAFAVAAFGLLWRFQEQLGVSGAVGGAAAGLGAIASAFQGAWAITLLPLGSAALVWDLARIGVQSRGISIIHGLSAIALVVPILGSLIDPMIILVVLAVPYPLTWLAIGASLLRGVPRHVEPAAG